MSREPLLLKRTLQEKLTAVIGSYGYQYVETPLLEETELFLRQSGGDLASRMYSFVDSGSSQISLRPEFTSPIMRHYLENPGAVTLPARYQYAGPVFRYDLSHPEGSGQFTQIGAELIGADGVMADAELVTMAADLADKAGVANYGIVLADLDVFHGLLDVAEVSERARSFILAAIPQLRMGGNALAEVREQAYQLHSSGPDSEHRDLSDAIAGLSDDEARQVIRGVLQWNTTDPRRFGQRDPEEIVGRFLRKLQGSDAEIARLEQGLAMAAKLASVSGAPAVAMPQARRVVEMAGANSGPLNRLEELLTVLTACPETSGKVSVDFGLVRGLAYYNGIVFEVRHPDRAGPVGGGGRYDGLARALGSPAPIPALGFAYTLEILLALTDMQTCNSLPMAEPEAVLVLAESPAGFGCAIRTAQCYREEGIRAEVEVSGRSLEQAKALASAKGISRVISVAPSGEQTAYDVE